MEFNKTTDLVELVAEKLTTDEKKCTKARAKELVTVMVDAMKELIADEEHCGLDIFGFTKWEVKEVEERTARNPQTGESVVVPSHNQLKIKASKSMKDLVR